MAYLYIDDGYPESEEYSNNYIFFKDNDLKYIKKNIKKSNKLKKDKSNHNILRRIYFNK